MNKFLENIARSLIIQATVERKFFFPASIIAFFFVSILSFTFAQITPRTDSTYKWINPEFNVLQFFDKQACEGFCQNWKQSSEKRLTIVHLGDSHLQSDIFPGELRSNLQSIHGSAGRGMMFPYATAKTYSSIEYKTSYTGDWTYAKSLAVPPKIPLGVSGMSCRTDEAGASFTFTFVKDPPAGDQVLKIFLKKQSQSFDFEIETAENKITVLVNDYIGNEYIFIPVPIPSLGKTIKLTAIRNSSSQIEFEFYGMSLESTEDAGLILHNCGVGGARYQSVLYEELFVSQLRCLDPDIVILDFGTNDFLYDDRIKPELDGEIRAAIALVRSVNPNVSIILTSSQDMYRRGRNIRSGEKFSDIVRIIAKETHCLFYDWYWIAGGRTMMKKWNEAGLSQPDMIHLSMSGYRLKGDLFSEAMTRTVEWAASNPNSDSLVISTDSIKSQQKNLLIQKYESPVITQANGSIRHVIKRGETLGHIAMRYGVSVSEIMKWNNLRSTLIIAGKSLIIYPRR